MFYARRIPDPDKSSPSCWKLNKYIVSVDSNERINRCGAGGVMRLWVSANRGERGRARHVCIVRWAFSSACCALGAAGVVGEQAFRPFLWHLPPAPLPLAAPALLAAPSSESYPEFASVSTPATLSCEHLLRHLSPLADCVRLSSHPWLAEDLEQLFVGRREGGGLGGGEDGEAQERSFEGWHGLACPLSIWGAKL